MKTISLLVLFFYIGICNFATAQVLDISTNTTLIQSSSQIKPLKVGDIVPDLLLGKILNYHGKSEVRTSDFKGKLLILDFWSVMCPICIQQFPKMFELQQHFSDDLVILPVGFDGNRDGSIESYYNRVKGSSREIKLPTLIQRKKDSLLMKLFPYRGLPQEVWISQEGIVLGITDHLAVTKQNIENILAGKTLNFSLKKVRKFVDRNNFLLKPAAGFSSQFVYGTAFAGYCDSLITFSSFGQSLNDTTLRQIIDLNRPVTEYYLNAYTSLLSEIDNKKYQDVIDFFNTAGYKSIYIDSTSKNFYKYIEYYNQEELDNWEYEDFASNNLFCYQLNLPIHYSKREVFNRMLKDLDEYFSIKSKLIEKHFKCLAIVRRSPNEPYKSNSEIEYSKTTDSTISYHKISFKRLASIISTWSDYFIVDETNYPNPIDVTIPLDNNLSLDKIKTWLNNNGLDLVLTTKKFTVISLTRTK